LDGAERATYEMLYAQSDDARSDEDALYALAPWNPAEELALR
jgi:hypothetical protein